MTILSNRQKEIASQIIGARVSDQWHDWHWQHRHTIRSVAEFELFVTKSSLSYLIL